MFVYNHNSGGIFDVNSEYKNEGFNSDSNSSKHRQSFGVKKSTRHRQQAKLTPCNIKFLQALGFKVKKL